MPKLSPKLGNHVYYSAEKIYATICYVSPEDKNWIDVKDVNGRIWQGEYADSLTFITDEEFSAAEVVDA